MGMTVIRMATSDGLQRYREDLDRLLVAARKSDADGGVPTADDWARRVLTAFGRCLAYDVTTDSLSKVAGEVLLTGAEALNAEVVATTATLPTLAERWRRTTNQSECDALAGGTLELRMDAWYAVEALDFAADSAAGEGRNHVLQAAVALDRAVQQYDALLEEHLDILATLVATPLLTGWRAALPARHDPLPWWLDGTLEAQALKTAAEAERGLSGGEFQPTDAGGLIPLVRPAAGRHADDALRSASAALAAYAASGRSVLAIEWTLPETSLQTTLYVTPGLAVGDELTFYLEDAAGGDAALRAVGEIVFLNGLPARWRRARGKSEDSVCATWPWSGAQQLLATQELVLVDGKTGVEWRRSVST